MTDLDEFREFLDFANFLTEALAPHALEPTLLNVPDIRQTRNYDCGAACVHSVAVYLGIDADRTQADYIRELGSTPQEGTRVEAILRWFRMRGVPVESREGMTLDDLRACWLSGQPVIVPLQDYGTKAEFRRNLSGHYVVVVGLGFGHVVIQDPSSSNAEAGGRSTDPDSVQDFGKLMIRDDVFLDVWHDADASGKILVRYGIAVGPRPVTESVQESTRDVNAQLRAHAEARQDATVERTDTAANALDRAIAKLLDDLATVLDARGTPVSRAQHLYALIQQAAEDSLGESLQKIAAWAYTHTAENLTRIIPVRQLQVAAENKVVGGRVREDVSAFGRFGLAHFAISDGGLTTTDPAAPLRDPTADLTDEEKRELFSRLLFPPVTLDHIFQVMGTAGPDGTWQEQLSRATSLASPDVLAGILTRGYAEGKTRAQLLQDLLPAVDGVKSSAARIARTEGLRIAHALNMEAHQQVDDLIVGYQIHATPGPNSRPWHQKRSGTIYYKEPKGNQKGFAQMPHPPEEAQDASERPAGTPQTAYC